MNKLVYFLMVGLAFTVLQISTVSAQTGAPVLTIGDPACAVPPAIGCPPGSPGLMAPPMGDPNMPPPMAPPMGMSSSLGAHCDEFAGLKRKRKEVRCLRKALDEHAPEKAKRIAKDGLGAYGCGSKNRVKHVSCLRDLLDEPGGKPGMAPGTN